jgi:hypothetical protein
MSAVAAALIGSVPATTHTSTRLVFSPPPNTKARAWSRRLEVVAVAIRNCDPSPAGAYDLI